MFPVSRWLRAFAFLLSFNLLLAAAPAPKGGGEVTGVIIDQAPDHPVESATVTLKNATTGAAVQSAVTDARGRFTLDDVPAGQYQLSYGYVGSDAHDTAGFAVAGPGKAVDLGRLDVGDQAIQLEKLSVTGKQREFSNTIDRKIYSVGREIQSATGSVSDLLQNIPSVQVDIDGNVSLRGSDNVMILLDGRTSTLMGKSRAEVLAQLPADSIDKIEVITNPSAKYKPDGTAGIINIVQKKKHASGVTTIVNASVGNDQRYNAGISTNYSTGAWNIFGSLSVRQDDRPRTASDIRTITDPVTGVATTLEKRSFEHSRPFTKIARAGLEYRPDEHDKFGLSGNYNRRGFLRTGVDHNLVRTSAGVITSDYDRERYDPEFERSSEWSATYQHTFPEPDHELNLEFKSSATKELEDNHYVDRFRTPVQLPTLDNTYIQPIDRGTEAIIEYTRPVGENAKFEAGYTRSAEQLFTNFQVSPQNLATGLFAPDPTKSNKFGYQQTIHAFYATWERTFGKFGFLAGLRPEAAKTVAHLVNTGEVITNDYFRVYPSLHLAYQLREHHELQLNYSHRVHRPESDDLNPFPEFQDPFTLRAGNPRLKPEDIHSIEAGYQFKNDDVSFVSTVYHRELYHGFTNVTRDIGNNVLLTTHENLASSRSTGVELAATADLGKKVSLNFSSNTFFNSIDASNLGFTGTKSDVSWSAKLGASIHAAKNTLIQFNGNYASTRLTPQGSRRPTYVANLGLRQEFRQKKLALIVTVSDLFNTLKESQLLDTPVLHEEVTRRRSSRITYVGFIYNFGQPSKKNKDDQLKFDNQI